MAMVCCYIVDTHILEWNSIIKVLKWTRFFRAAGTDAKNKSISRVLPLPAEKEEEKQNFT